MFPQAHLYVQSNWKMPLGNHFMELHTRTGMNMSNNPPCLHDGIRGPCYASSDLLTLAVQIAMAVHSTSCLDFVKLGKD